MNGGDRTRGAALLLAVGLVLLCGVLATTVLAQDAGGDDRSVGELATAIESQYDETKAAADMASEPVPPALLGGGLGVGLGAIGGAVFAYQNRGMR
ncbi:hypothetical protein [Halobaculum rubrum]|uniref:hypothetical protein n=1 Tax=Halobaculum rubrum TaxID=2872158 RepID=UPI001CA39BCA|nr:hypothetical protein [Halobaculum rubrum]QZX99086.1 hypothetical protein K6T25_12610 [Halobaculum rubrum]